MSHYYPILFANQSPGLFYIRGLFDVYLRVLAKCTGDQFIYVVSLPPSKGYRPCRKASSQQTPKNNTFIKQKRMENIFTVSERCTEHDVSELYEQNTPQQSYVTSHRQSYISNNSFLNRNIARIGLEKLSRVFKVKTKQYKRNALESIKFVGLAASGTRKEGIQKLCESKSREDTSLQKSKSLSKIELLNDIMGKLQRKPGINKSSTNADNKVNDSSSKSSYRKYNQPIHRMSTQQSSLKKTPQGMYFKRLRQNIMNIKRELNQIQKVNEDLWVQNKMLKMKQNSQSMRSLISYRPPSYLQIPMLHCTDCGNQFLPPIRLIQQHSGCGCNRIH